MLPFKIDWDIRISQEGHKAIHDNLVETAEKN